MSLESGGNMNMNSAKIAIKGWTPVPAKPSSPFTHVFDNSIFRKSIPPPPMIITSRPRRTSLFAMQMATTETDFEIVETPIEFGTKPEMHASEH